MEHLFQLLRKLDYKGPLDPESFVDFLHTSDANPAIVYALERKVQVNPKRLQLVTWLLEFIDKDGDILERVDQVRTIDASCSEQLILVGSESDDSI